MAYSSTLLFVSNKSSYGTGEKKGIMAMNVQKGLFVGLILLSMAWVQNVKAQDFGVKSSTPAVYLIGGGWNYQGFHITTGNLPQIYCNNVELNDKNLNLTGMALHGLFGVRKYFGSSGFHIEPNLLLSIGFATGEYYCPSIFHDNLTLSYINNDIIPSVSVGYDFFDAKGEVFGFYVGVGFWGDFFYNAKLKDRSKTKYDVSCLSNFMGRFVVNVGLRPADIRGIYVRMNASIGIGNTYKSIDCKLLNSDFQIEKPLFLVSLSLQKKYQKY